MFYVHYFQNSPEGSLVVQIYFGSFHIATWTFAKREDFHDLVKSLFMADKQINSEDYSEDKWTPNLTKEIFDILS